MMECQSLNSISCIYKFLSKSKWDEQLIDRNRLNYLNLCFVDLIKPNYNNDNCLELNKPFKSKIEIAKDFIENFKKPSNCEKIYYS